jgi:heat shock protein HtpX
MFNSAKTALLLGLLTGLILLIGGMLGGKNGVVFALILAGGVNFFSYWFSDKIVLRSYGAQELSPEEAPRLYNILQALTSQAGMPMPKLYLIPTDTPNAFATGRNENHAAVAVTHGILNMLNDNEIAGVLGHELSHIKDRDILISSIAATLAGAIMWLATMAKWGAIFGGFRGGDDDDGPGIFGLILLAILAPIAAMLIQLAISRSREFIADEEGAKLAGNSRGLANALEKLEYGAANNPMPANQNTAHLFIVNPLRGEGVGGFIRKLFSTHPPTEDRVARLRSLNF